MTVPGTRFPSFSDRWTFDPLSKFLTEHGLTDDGKSEVCSVSVHKGVINQKEHLGRSFAAADTSNYHLARPFDVVYTKSPTGEFPFGVVKQNRMRVNALVSPLYGVFSPSSPAAGHVIDAFFESPARANAFLEPLVQKGAKNTLQISNDRFLSGKIWLPLSGDEMTEIEQCLDSIDELIGAETNKVRAMKAHKAALMQKLFPSVGE